VVGSCFGVRYCSYLGGGGVSRVGKSSGCTRLRLWCAKLRFCRYVGPSDRRRVRGGLPSLCRLRWAEHVAHMGEKRNACGVLALKPE